MHPNSIAPLNAVSPTPLKVLGIAGSLRAASYNRSALRAARKLAPPGMVVDIFELEDLPVFNQDAELTLPKRVSELKARIRSSDAILFATPEHNYGIPAALKNALDWASRPWGDNTWAGKPAAIMGASTGTLGTVRAQMQLRQTFAFLDLLPLNRPEVMIPLAQEKFDADGHLNDATSRAKIRKLLEALATWVLRLRFNHESPDGIGPSQRQRESDALISGSGGRGQ